MRRLDVLVEACVESVAEAELAGRLGADRIELCVNLAEDGLTPPPELVNAVLAAVKVPVRVLVRPQAGGFAYGEEDFKVLRTSVRAMLRLGVAGIVTGALTPAGDVDAVRLAPLVVGARPMPMTFHRAFDRAKYPGPALEAVVALGFDGVLTSGGVATAFEGRHELRDLVTQAAGRLQVIAAGKVEAGTVRQLVEETDVTAIHLRVARLEGVLRALGR